MSRIPTHLIEALHAGALSDEDAQALRRRIATDPTAQQALDAFAASDADVLQAHPPAAVVAEVERRRRATVHTIRTPRARVALAAITALGVGIGVVVVLPKGNPVEGGQGLEMSTPTERAKGSAALEVYRVPKSGVGEAERLADGATVRAGDTVQLRYRAAGKAYGVIVSIDGGQGIVVHSPEQPSTDTRLIAGEAVALPHAFLLDDAPKFELFIFVTSDVPIDVDEVYRAARNLADGFAPDHRSLDNPHAWQQVSVLLQKDES